MKNADIVGLVFFCFLMAIVGPFVFLYWMAAHERRVNIEKEVASQIRSGDGCLASNRKTLFLPGGTVTV